MKLIGYQIVLLSICCANLFAQQNSILHLEEWQEFNKRDNDNFELRTNLLNQVKEKVEQETDKTLKEKKIALQYLMEGFMCFKYDTNKANCDQHIYKALDLFKKHNDSLGIVECYFNLSFSNFGNIEFIDTLYDGLAISKNLKDTSSILAFLSELGRLHLNKGNFSESLKYINEQSSYLRKDTDKLFHRHYFYKYIIYSTSGLRELSLNYLQKHIDLCHKLNSEYYEIESKIEMGRQLYILERYNEAFAILNNLSIGDYKRQFYYIKNYYLGLNYIARDSLEQASNYLDSLKLNSKFKRSIRDNFYIDNLEIKILEKKGNFFELKSKAAQIINEQKRQKYYSRELEIYLLLISVYQKEKNYSKIIGIKDSVFNCITKLPSKERIIEANETYYQVYAKQNNFKEALYHLEKKIKHANYIDSVQDGFLIEESVLGLENTLLKRKNELETLASKNKSQKIFYLVIILGITVLLLIIASILFVNVRKKKKIEKQLIEEELKELKIELAHKEKAMTRMSKLDLSEDSIIDRLAKTDDWIELFVLTEEKFNISFSSISQKIDQITKTDLKIIALSLYRLSNKEIADILKITESGAKKAKQRVRSKLNLPRTLKLADFILEN